MAAHICQALLPLAQQYPERPAALCAGRALSGAGLLAAVAGLSASLASATPLGLRPGEVVAIAAHNSERYMIALLAVTAAGGTAALLNWRWSGAEATAACRQVRAAVLMADGPCAGLAARLQSDVPGLRACIWLDDDEHAHGIDALQLTSMPQLRLSALLASPAAARAATAALHQHALPLLASPGGTAVIVFTSGTTGEPKGALLTHQSFVVQSLTKLAVVGYSAGDVFLHSAPLFHIGGLSSALAMLMARGISVFLPRFSAQGFVDAARAHAATASMALPAMLVDVLATVRAEQAAAEGRGGGVPAPAQVIGSSVGAGGGFGPRHVLPSMRTLLIGGAALPPDLQAGTSALFPSARLVLAYGMTEACSTLAFHTLHDPDWRRGGRPAPGGRGGAAQLGSGEPRAADAACAEDDDIALAGPSPAGPDGGWGFCVGHPSPHMELRILAASEAASEVGATAAGPGGGPAGPPAGLSPADARPPPRREGQVLARGPAISAGYCNAPEATAAAFRDGWLLTGDAGWLDGCGRLWLSGRIKDVIRSGGENVHAAEVEAAAASHPAVLAAAAVPVPDARLGEAVGVLLCLRPGWALEGSCRRAAPTASTSSGAEALTSGPGGGDGPREPQSQLLTLDSLRAHCRGRGLSPYKLPRAAAASAGPLPANASGKLLKAEVARQLLVALREGRGVGIGAEGGELPAARSRL